MWLQRQQFPATLATWERELDNGETLALTTEAILLRRGDAEIWSHELVPDLGTGLELEAFGEELILLVERPAIGTSLGAQGIPHLLNRETGGEVEIPVRPDAQYFVPLEFNGRRLLLTPSGVVFE
ncbi:MAG: hypothetical protein A2Y63_04755 [Candidatus Riflebacteria bacterium RBG_13_59_9]|nr:MAG: hypothetical protein A2Y63_04755 [Candidatus Riflebacteria bacterium RBG_13_59_9]